MTVSIFRFQGNGTRAGSGKCKCHKGYSGEKCYLCESGYEIAEQNETFISCEGTCREAVVATVVA